MPVPKPQKLNPECTVCGRKLEGGPYFLNPLCGGEAGEKCRMIWLGRILMRHGHVKRAAEVRAEGAAKGYWAPAV